MFNKIIFLSLIALSTAQVNWPVCDPFTVDWHSHPRNCSLYLICFHGVMHTMNCAPGLHFSRTQLKCMLPEDANCDFNYMCPAEDDDQNPVFLPDPDDCGIYYVCSRGYPIQRECAPGFWFDVRYRWCNVPEEVECDDRTIVNPDNPGDRTTTTTTTFIPPTTNEPNFSACNMREDLFIDDIYHKSMCIRSQSMNYEASRQGCESLNMNLFIIDNSTLQDVFFEATTRLLINQPRGFVWINGRRNESLDIWNVFNADGSLMGRLTDDITWVSTDTIDGRTSGECLRYSQQHGPYEAMGVACTAASWFICEYSFQTSDPPTTTPQLITTTEEISMPPNINSCRNTRNLHHNENYLKSMCIIATNTNYANAENICRANNMELFVIDDFQVQAAFRDATTEILAPDHSRGFLWINGRIHGSCETWHVFDPNPRAMFGGIHFLQTDEISGAISGPCLRFSAQHTVDWLAMGQACESNSWFVCEYNQNDLV